MIIKLQRRKLKGCHGGTPQAALAGSPFKGCRLQMNNSPEIISCLPVLLSKTVTFWAVLQALKDQ